MASKEKILLLQEKKKKAQSPNWVMSGEWNKDQTGHKSKSKQNRRTWGWGRVAEQEKVFVQERMVGRGPREPGFQKLTVT